MIGWGQRLPSELSEKKEKTREIRKCNAPPSASSTFIWTSTTDLGNRSRITEASSASWSHALSALYSSSYRNTNNVVLNIEISYTHGHCEYIFQSLCTCEKEMKILPWNGDLISVRYLDTTPCCDETPLTYILLKLRVHLEATVWKWNPRIFSGLHNRKRRTSRSRTLANTWFSRTTPSKKRQ